MLFLLLLTTILAVLIVKQHNEKRKLPNGPEPIPLLGNIPQLVYYITRCGGVVEAFNELRARYGRVFTVWIGPLPTVYVAEYEVANETHVKRGNLFSARFSPGFTDYLRNGRGIISSNGSFWQEHRRFALATLRNFGVGRGLMEEKIMEEYRYRIDDFKKPGSDNIEVSASTFFDLLVGSIINQLLVSKRFEKDDEEFIKLKDSLTESFEKFSLIDIFLPTKILESRFLKWRQEKILAPPKYVLRKSQEQINQRLEDIKNGDHEIINGGNDFVDAYIAKMEKDERDGIDTTFTVENLAIDMLDLWLAGQETTSTTLSWACLCLLNHPEVVKKVREELMRVTGGNRNLSLADRPQTPYLNATINEVQRIASILNLNLFRWISEDTEIDGQPLRAGTALTTHLSLIHTDERLFKNAAEFDPERFLRDERLEKMIIPFGIGKRSCLGESLARAELYLIAGNLLMEYDLEPIGELPPIQTTTPFGILKRVPKYDIRFVSVNQ